MFTIIIIGLGILIIGVIMGGIITGILNPYTSIFAHRICWILCSVIVIILLIIMSYWQLTK